METKNPINPDRIRKVPKQFTWIDGRLVRDGYLQQCSHGAAALYLFLITVSDVQGLSYYGDKSVCKQLSMDSCLLAESKLLLIQLSLIAYRKPFYQVLELAPARQATARNCPDTPVQSLGQILKQLGEAAP
jgi:hypothetical protein